ncbi:MAG: signal peptide peptidase SppA [Bacteroidales bacterium]|nr:signal peptide peptidase SppA [Candidatus Physcousia equi]
MGQFFKMVGATIVGLLLWSLLFVIFAIIGIAGIASSESNVKIEENSILRIRLNGMMAERNESSALSFLAGEGATVSLEQVLTAINKASKNENIKGIYIEGGALSASPAMLQEIRQALARFKKESKKWIVSYADSYTQGCYYVCSVADELYLNPSGMLDWHGLGGEITFYADVLKKVGVKMQVFKVGTFKSAVEPYIGTEMSEPNREQVRSYLTSIWQVMLKDVAESRKISTNRLNALADTLTTFLPTATLVKEKMVTELFYKDQVRDRLKTKTERDEKEGLRFVSPSKMARAEEDIEKREDCIVVYYAHGDIVDDMTSSITGANGACIAPEPMNRELETLRNDEQVKAVVIRVNSGGGSAFASEQIWHEIERLKAKKPVVISMGGMAGSGGYYISCGASRILAEPTTLTGSIGIFGLIPDASELMTEKIGLHYDGIQTNRYGNFGTMSRGMNEEESRMMQNYIERGYDLFTRRVAEGRNISQDSVKVIAEGRVWTGEQALKIGLVDQLGDLQDAIREAAKLAKISDYNLYSLPEEKSFWSQLFGGEEEEDGKDLMEMQLKALLGELYEPFVTLRNLRSANPVQARLPYLLRIE